MCRAAIAAIEYAVRDEDPKEFLWLWLQGDFETIRKEWSEVPADVFKGADILVKPEEHEDEE